jgi:hypothetical protein
MTYAQLEKQVEQNLLYIRNKLADSPQSARDHLNRGIGFVQAIGNMYDLNVIELIEKMEKEMPR